MAVTAITLEDPDLPPLYRARMEAIREQHWASCEEAIRQGVNVVPGTDCGVPGILPSVLWREISLLHERGLPRMDAVRAGTSRAAALLGVDAEVGGIKVGKQADIILVAGDPLVDLSSLGQIHLVMQSGAIVYQ